METGEKGNRTSGARMNRQTGGRTKRTRNEQKSTGERRRARRAGAAACSEANQDGTELAQPAILKSRWHSLSRGTAGKATIDRRRRRRDGCPALAAQREMARHPVSSRGRWAGSRCSALPDRLVCCSHLSVLPVSSPRLARAAMAASAERHSEMMTVQQPIKMEDGESARRRSSVVAAQSQSTLVP